MTPTLFGRWQTRILLFAIIGSLVNVPFFLLNGNNPAFFFMLAYIAILGLGWDVLYHYLQQFRWDHDWPAVLQLLAAIGEGVLFAILYKLLPLPAVPQTIPLSLFVLNYSLVWLAVFVTSQSIMRIVFPRWRFHGGQWL